MLVLTRKPGESIVIGDDVVIKVLSVEGESIRLGITAPRALPVYRQELLEAVRQENLRAALSAEQPEKLAELLKKPGE